MMRDVVRAACVIAVMAVAASLVVEVRLRMAAIDLAHRGACPAVHPYPPPPEAGPVTRLGRAALGLADSMVGVLR